MSERRQMRGVPWPSLWQAAVVIACVTGAWLLWSEFRERAAPPHRSLAQQNAAERIQAIEALAQRGSDAISDLVELSSDADPKIRRLALFGLGRIGPDAAEAIETIRARLIDEDPDVRFHALFAFGRVCRDREEVIAVSGCSLGDTADRVRGYAAEILEGPENRTSPTLIPVVIPMTRRELTATRKLALHVLARADARHDDAAVTQAMRNLLNDSDADVRSAAIAQVAGRGAAHLTQVRGWLREADPGIVRSALGAVFWLGPEGPRALPELISLLETCETAQLYPVIECLRALKNAARPAVPFVLPRIEALGRLDQLRAADTLLEIGADPADIVSIVMPLLWSNDKTSSLNREAARLLARASPSEARRLAASLVSEIQDDKVAITESKLHVFYALGSEAREAVPLLTRLIQSSEGPVSYYATAALGNMGAEASPAVPTLIAMLKRPKTYVYASARDENLVQALGKIGPSSQNAVPVLLGILELPIPSLQEMNELGAYHPPIEQAITALGRIGDNSDSVVARLRRHLAPDESSAVRLAALRSLIALGEDSELLLADLLLSLDDSSSAVRFHAALAIASFSGDRHLAVTRLAKAVSDDNPWIGSAAAMALQDIGPDAISAAPALRVAARDSRNGVPNGIRMPGGEGDIRGTSHGEYFQRLSVANAARMALAAIQKTAESTPNDRPTVERIPADPR